MARTAQEVYDVIIAKKQTFPVLAEMDSVSAVAVFKLWGWITAEEISLFETIFDQAKSDLQEIVDSNVYGTAPWFVSILKKFQEGDNLQILPNGTLGYSIIDESKQIIKHASFLEQTGGIMLLKVATEAGAVLGPITNEQLTQVRGYLNKRRPAGVRYSVISEEADKLRMVAEVYYNPLFTLDTIKTNVEAAVTAYLNNLSFDGIVYASKLTDVIQEIEGVEDIYINQLTGISSAGNTLFNRSYRARAGYLIPDDTAGNTLADTITYIVS